MKDKLRKLAGWRPSPVLYVCGSLLMLVLLLLPLLRLTQYSIPWYDDYNYGRFAKAAMSKAPAIWNALKGAWECIRISWHAWQGTYSSIFFMVMMPGIWGEEYYRFGPMFLILFLTVCVCILVYTLLRTVLETDRLHGAGIAAVSAALAVVMIHTAQEGFYWYNGGVHYVGMHGFSMLLVAASVMTFYAKTNRKRVLFALVSALLAFVTAGGNLVTSLQGLLLMLSILALGFVVRKKQAFVLVPALLVYLCGFGLNMTAPGNDKRAESYVGWGMSAVESILYSFVEAFKHMWEFTGWMTILILVLMFPLLWHMVNRVSFHFRWPGLVTAWSVCLYATGFTPSLYSLGHAGLGRTLNAVKLTWQLLLILNMVYWCGYLARRMQSKEKVQERGKMYRWWSYVLIGATAVLIFHAEPNQAGSFSSYGAYYYVHTGEAYNFYQEYLKRVELLKSGPKTVVLQPYNWKPWFLYMGDLSEDPTDSANEAIAEWYGKKEVICTTDMMTTK